MYPLVILKPSFMYACTWQISNRSIFNKRLVIFAKPMAIFEKLAWQQLCNNYLTHLFSVNTESCLEPNFMK